MHLFWGFFFLPIFAKHYLDPHRPFEHATHELSSFIYAYKEKFDKAQFSRNKL